MSLTEAITNVAVGYIAAVATQLVVFPVFEVDVSLTENAAIGAVFTIVSIVRSYSLRRLFEQVRLETT